MDFQAAITETDRLVDKLKFSVSNYISGIDQMMRDIGIFTLKCFDDIKDYKYLYDLILLLFNRHIRNTEEIISKPPNYIKENEIPELLDLLEKFRSILSVIEKFVKIMELIYLIQKNQHDNSENITKFQNDVEELLICLQETLPGKYYCWNKKINNSCE